jgi:hypothetical protein
MERLVRVVRIVVGLTLGVLVLVSWAPGFAKDKPKSPPSATSAGSATTKGKPPPGENVNACGCYRDARGGCVCTDKKGKCECPGECEPVGCGEKRDKEIEREMAAEVKRVQDEEKKRQADREAQEAKENGAASPDAGEEAPAVAAKPSKPARKGAGKQDPKAEPPKDQKK